MVLNTKEISIYPSKERVQRGRVLALLAVVNVQTDEQCSVRVLDQGALRLSWRQNFVASKCQASGPRINYSTSTFITRCLTV